MKSKNPTLITPITLKTRATFLGVASHISPDETALMKTLLTDYVAILPTGVDATRLLL